MHRLKEEKLFHTPPPGRWMVLAACLLCMWTGHASALGTPAGTAISSTATVDYTLVSDPTPLTTTTSNSFNVIEIIDVTLTWQDTAPVPVNTPHAGMALSFLLTNTGNGPEGFLLTTTETLGGDQFDPQNISLWIESNGTPGFQADDTTYPAGGISLTADENALIYVVSDIPSGLIIGDIGTVQLTAAAQTPVAAGQAPGTLLPGAGFNGVDAVVGTTGADGDTVGSYEVSTVSVVLDKNIIRIVDPTGGDRPHPGAQVTYRIDVNINGNGTAEALVITDLIPSDMTYANGSIVLDDMPLTDGLDADQGDFNVSAAGTVTINLGDTVAPATHRIEFDTTIN